MIRALVNDNLVYCGEDINEDPSYTVEPELEVLPELVSALLIRRPPQKNQLNELKNPHELFAPGGTNWRPKTLVFFSQNTTKIISNQ